MENDLNKGLDKADRMLIDNLDKLANEVGANGFVAQCEFNRAVINALRYILKINEAQHALLIGTNTQAMFHEILNEKLK